MDLPEPVAGEGEVLVRVRATSVNPADVLVQRFVYRDRLEYRFPVVFGRDAAGTVEAVGPGVDRHAVGDELFGFVKRDYIGDGGFADYVVVPQDRYLVQRPVNVTMEEAGALGLASVTALQCLDELRVASGTVLLVNGATGGVGSFAVQIARSLGAHVIATGRPGEEEEHVRAMGADETVDWSAGDTAVAVRERHPGGVEAVLDLVSDRERVAGFAEHVLTEGGRGATTRVDDPEQPPGRSLVMVHSAGDPALLGRIVALVESGAVRVPITHRFGFEDLPAAFAKLGEGVCGKIAVAIAD
jgi:NADPH:quinone reductase-like Zn-dependent oxidoreductase